MRLYFTTVVSIFILQINLLSQVKADANKSEISNDIDMSQQENINGINDENTITLDDVKDVENELELNQIERREIVSLGGLYSWGLISSWGKHTLTLLYKLNSNLFLDISTAIGSFDYEGKKEEYNYIIKHDTYSSLIGVQYFFSHHLPIFIFINLGYVLLNGDISPSFINTVNIEQSMVQNLDSGFNIHAVSTNIGIGFFYIYNNNIFISYHLYGYGLSYPMSVKYTSPSRIIKNIVPQYVKAIRSWGIINIGIGYYLK